MEAGSSELAERIIEFCHTYIRVPEGANATAPLILRPWQQEIIRGIYSDPRPRRVIISFGRKNGKTALTAILVLAHLVGPAVVPNSQIYSAAQSKEQAAVVYELAMKMVRQSPELNALIRPVDSKKEMHSKFGVYYRALSAEASTAYGLSPVFVIHDELGQVKGPTSELYDALETGAGAHSQPLSVIISTQAPTDADLLSKLIDDAESDARGRTRVFLHSCPIDHPEPFSRGAVALANPALGDFLNEAEVMDEAEDARRISSQESRFRNLHLNQRVEASSPFVSRTLWASCGAEPKPIDKVPVYGGLDLSEVADLTALIWMGRVDGIWQIHPTFWLPKEGLAEKARKDRVPYDIWEKEGKLLAAPGKSIDYDYVAQVLFQDFKRYDVRKVAFDRWNFRHLRPCLLRAGFTEAQIEEKFVEFGQGYQSMSPALRTLESEILNARVAHGNHPVLTMCAANAVVQTDPAGNRKLTKSKSSGRIDGMVALAEAMGVVPEKEEPPRDFKLMFV